MIVATSTFDHKISVRAGCPVTVDDNGERRRVGVVVHAEWVDDHMNVTTALYSNIFDFATDGTLSALIQPDIDEIDISFTVTPLET